MRRRSRSAIARPALAAALGAAAALVVAVAGGGCGEGSEPGEPARPLGDELAGSVAPLVQCRDWTKGSLEEKLATIEDIRAQVNREDSGVSAPPLSDEEALEVLDNACAEDFADGFRLYVLYARAAGFAPLVR